MGGHRAPRPPGKLRRQPRQRRRAGALGALRGQYDIILGILRSAARSIVKSKCMTTEEIHLNDLLEKEGFGVVEHLGGHIQQLRKGAVPLHLPVHARPARRHQLLFHDHLGSAPATSRRS
ncbi:MAG: hypothetical protein U1F77_16515 [Kiritimatiellia bacterium]